MSCRVVSCIESVNQRLSRELIPHSFPSEWRFGFPHVLTLIAEYAAYTLIDVPPSRHSGPSVIPPKHLPVDKNKPQYVLKRVRYEDTKVCMKVSDGQLITAMRYIIQFASHIEDRKFLFCAFGGRLFWYPAADSSCAYACVVVFRR